jgi:hypothetical protein
LPSTLWFVQGEFLPFMLCVLPILTWLWWWATSKLACRGVMTQQTEDKQCIRLVLLHACLRNMWAAVPCGTGWRNVMVAFVTSCGFILLPTTQN